MLAGGWCWPDWRCWRTAGGLVVVTVDLHWLLGLLLLLLLSSLTTISPPANCNQNLKISSLKSTGKYSNILFYHWLIPVKYSNIRHDTQYLKYFQRHSKLQNIQHYSWKLLLSLFWVDKKWCNISVKSWVNYSNNVVASTKSWSSHQALQLV